MTDLTKPAEQRTGTAASLAILAVIGSYALTFTMHPVWGLVCACIAIPLALLGIVVAASPRTGGGVLSIVALSLGLLALAIAILGVIGAVMF